MDPWSPHIPNPFGTDSKFKSPDLDFDIWVFPKIMVPKNVWFIVENSLKWMSWGVFPYFWKHPSWKNRYVYVSDAHQQSMAVGWRGVEMEKNRDFSLEISNETSIDVASNTWSALSDFVVHSIIVQYLSAWRGGTNAWKKPKHHYNILQPPTVQTAAATAISLVASAAFSMS